jgi:hypothetical protein
MRKWNRLNKNLIINLHSTSDNIMTATPTSTERPQQKDKQLEIKSTEQKGAIN